MNIIITGANRGIGLEFVRQYAEDGEIIYACCRQPDKALELKKLADKHGNIKICELDVTKQISVAKLHDSIKDIPFHLLINNAGIYGDKNHQSLGDMNYASWEETLAINTMAPLRLIETFLPCIRKAGPGAKIVTISSQMGAMSRKAQGSYAYRSSKTAVNKVMQLVAMDLAPEDIIVCPFHPGWVRTDMGGVSADIDVKESVSGLRKVISNLTMKDTGKFWQYDGKELDW